MKTPVLESLFNKVAGLQASQLKSAKYLRTPILENIYERLLLAHPLFQTSDLEFHPLVHNVKKWSSMISNSCNVNAAKFLKYV